MGFLPACYDCGPLQPTTSLKVKKENNHSIRKKMNNFIYHLVQHLERQIYVITVLNNCSQFILKDNLPLNFKMNIPSFFIYFQTLLQIFKLKLTFTFLHPQFFLKKCRFQINFSSFLPETNINYPKSLSFLSIIFIFLGNRAS